jgi:hypothetical protein
MFPEVRFLRSPAAGTAAGSTSGGQAQELCRALENGGILVLPETPLLGEADLRFLAAARQVKSKFHKNISFKPKQNRLAGFDRTSAEGTRMQALMREYSQLATQLMGELLEPYRQRWQLDLASFRPIAEQGRIEATRSRNDLLHIDSFPTRPTNGGRILRVFTNANSTEPRVWTTTISFREIAQCFALEAGLERIANVTLARRRALRFTAPVFRLANSAFADRSPYDRFMLSLHDFLKRNSAFQQQTPKLRVEFPPRATWIAFTDMVAHAVESGQFALEHTYIVPADAMMVRDQAPVAILEKLCGRALTN